MHRLLASQIFSKSAKDFLRQVKFISALMEFCHKENFKLQGHKTSGDRKFWLQIWNVIYRYCRSDRINEHAGDKKSESQQMMLVCALIRWLAQKKSTHTYIHSYTYTYVCVYICVFPCESVYLYSSFVSGWFTVRILFVNMCVRLCEIPVSPHAVTNDCHGEFSRNL